ncbi:hypothetical protein [Dysgonomonas sp. Marseille-P4361]|uniref:hypothetical protein n=1 Tax=Dysgonomonas sp. Marseille-P4361 TaxID=2161820 RepID=UPI00135C4CE8|nr:hypothetical protein [Dysgonomonas sp. Marseille-P4361]
MSIGIGLALSFISTTSHESLSTVPFLRLLISFLRSWCLFGLPFTLLYKELARKNEYYFYQNAGISKVNLIAFTFMLYILFSVLIYILSYIAWNIIF